MSRVEFFSDLALLFGNDLIALRFGRQLACVLSQAWKDTRLDRATKLVRRARLEVEGGNLAGPLSISWPMRIAQVCRKRCGIPRSNALAAGACRR
jgi:hypothetical protein